MIDRNFLLSKLKPFQNKNILLYDNQSTSDIIKVLLQAHKIYTNQYDKICMYFWKGNVYKTCQYIYDFLKKNVKYSIEPDTRQSVKSPSAIIVTGQYYSGMNDCKHYSSFIGGILSALCRKGININWKYRFANYKLFNTVPHHVFCVCVVNNNEIWIDPVINGFNVKKRYINKIDKKI